MVSKWSAKIFVSLSHLPFMKHLTYFSDLNKFTDCMILIFKKQRYYSHFKCDSYKSGHLSPISHTYKSRLFALNGSDHNLIYVCDTVLVKNENSHIDNEINFFKRIKRTTSHSLLYLCIYTHLYLFTYTHLYREMSEPRYKLHF